MLVEDHLKKINNVTAVKASQRTGQVEISYQGEEPSPKSIEKEIINAGYKMGKSSSLPIISDDYRDYRDLLIGSDFNLILSQ
jgi:copper chaperone CopZ